MALREDLNWTSSGGKTFTLQPIPPLYMQRFLSEWQKRHPEPQPPLREVQIADKTVTQPDHKDEWFVIQHNAWTSRLNDAQTDFTLAYGVVDTPPSEWQPDPLLFSDDLQPWQRKAAWVSGFLITTADLEGLPEAIFSLNGITQQGLDEAEKN